MDAEGFHERAGAQVLALPQEPHRAVSADWVDDLDFEYRSEEARHTAERVIETSTSSFATVNEASGAAFVGSGVGAMNLDFGLEHSLLFETQDDYLTSPYQYESVQPQSTQRVCQPRPLTSNAYGKQSGSQTISVRYQRPDG